MKPVQNQTTILMALTILSGIKPFFFSSLRINFSAAALFHLVWTKTSSTSPAPGAALRTIGFSVSTKQGLRANNRAENLHQPVRRRERKMGGFKITNPAQRFVSFHAAVYNTFNVQRYLICRTTHRRFRAKAHNVWNDAPVVGRRSPELNDGSSRAQQRVNADSAIMRKSRSAPWPQD